MLTSNRRFLIAGVIPFLCIFSQTLLQYNAMFALGGMINHTLADWPTLAEWEESVRLRVEDRLPQVDTCMSARLHNAGHTNIRDGPFPWDHQTEGIINSIMSPGVLAGTIMSLFVYDVFNHRLLFAVALGFPGLLNILTPTFADHGGWLVTSIFRFFTGLYTALLTPLIPGLVNHWFVPSELYRMGIGVWLAVEFGRMFFCLTGDIVNTVGWEFLFYFPGGLSILIAFLFYIFMTEDPLENHWLSCEEKSLLARAQSRPYKPATASSATTTVTRLKNYKNQMKMKNRNTLTPPWSKIIWTPMLWLATLQATATNWSGLMMVLMVKEYLEEIHGYSLQEAAIMATIPNTVAQFFLGLAVGYLGDRLDAGGVSGRTIRRLGAGVQVLAVLPLLVLPFLPCSWISYRVNMVVFQVLASFREFGNMAVSYRDISPTFDRHLRGLSSMISLFLPGLVIPATMASIGTTRHGQWQKLFVINSSVVLLGHLTYIATVRTNTASWEPKPKSEGPPEALHTLMEDVAPHDATERLAEQWEHHE